MSDTHNKSSVLAFSLSISSTWFLLSNFFRFIFVSFYLLFLMQIFTGAERAVRVHVRRFRAKKINTSAWTKERNRLDFLRVHGRNTCVARGAPRWRHASIG